MGKLLRVDDRNVSELHVEILVHRVQSSSESQVILQLQDDLLAYECLEKGKEMLAERKGGKRAKENRGFVKQTNRREKVTLIVQRKPI